MILYKFLWIIDRTKDDQNAKLQFRVKWNNSKCIATFSPMFNVDASKWSQDAQRCKANTTHTDKCIPANIINKRLDQYEQYAIDVFNDFDSRNEMPTVDQFKQRFNVARGTAKPIHDNSELVMSVFDMFIESVSKTNNWAVNTKASMRGTMNALCGYKPDLQINDVTDDEIFSFIQYLTKKHFKNTYIRKVYKNIVEMLTWLSEKGIYTGNSHKTFKMRFKGALDYRQVIYLTWDELLKLYDMHFKNLGHEWAKDAFCLCCFTSLRYSDLAKLQRCDVKEDRIEVVTQKTDEALSINLNKYSKAILDKYKDATYIKGHAVPVLANAVMNRYLKVICREAGFDEQIKIVYYSGHERFEEVHPKYELITTHCGRRTFIVNALYLGIPAEVVMKWTGHEDYKAMKPYVAIVDELKAREMAKFDIGR